MDMQIYGYAGIERALLAFTKHTVSLLIKPAHAFLWDAVVRNAFLFLNLFLNILQYYVLLGHLLSLATAEVVNGILW